MNRTRTKPRNRTRRWIGIAATLAAFLVLAPFAVETHAQGNLPEAAVILDKYEEASGGTAAYDKVKNRVIKATMEIKGQGISLDMVIYQAKPRLSYTLIESEITGKIEKGKGSRTAVRPIKNPSKPQIARVGSKEQMVVFGIVGGIVFVVILIALILFIS